MVDPRRTDYWRALLMLTAAERPHVRACAAVGSAAGPAWPVPTADCERLPSARAGSRGPVRLRVLERAVCGRRSRTWSLLGNSGSMTSARQPAGAGSAACAPDRQWKLSSMGTSFRRRLREPLPSLPLALRPSLRRDRRSGGAVAIANTGTNAAVIGWPIFRRDALRRLRVCGYFDLPLPSCWLLELRRRPGGVAFA